MKVNPKLYSAANINTPAKQARTPKQTQIAEQNKVMEKQLKAIESKKEYTIDRATPKKEAPGTEAQKSPNPVSHGKAGSHFSYYS